MDLQIHGSVVVAGGNRIEVGAPVLSAVGSDTLILVLVDPDSYLTDPEYRRKRRSGIPAVRNLRAFSTSGTPLWEAELPEAADYYHRIIGIQPIVVDSFSGYRCQISALTGKIESHEFMK